MNRQLVKVLTLLFLAMAVLAHEGEEEPASLGTVANSTDAGMTMPGMAMPGMAMPGMEMPGMEMPATTSPEAATTSPEAAKTSPEASTLPATTMPGMEMPGMEMPATTSPETSTLPATTMPGMAASETMMMTPYFHFMGASDALWFKTWVPRTSGALAGACIGLILLAVFERFLGGVKGLIEASWSRSMASHATPDNASIHSYSKSLESGNAYLTNTAPGPLIPAFEPMHDLIRGGMMAFQSLIGFFLMLSVMTFNVTFLLSVIIGLGIGEVIFARWARSGANPGCVSSRSPGPIA